MGCCIVQRGPFLPYLSYLIERQTRAVTTHTYTRCPAYLVSTLKPRNDTSVECPEGVSRHLSRVTASFKVKNAIHGSSSGQSRTVRIAREELKGNSHGGQKLPDQWRVTVSFFVTHVTHYKAHTDCELHRKKAPHRSGQPLVVQPRPDGVRIGPKRELSNAESIFPFRWKQSYSYLENVHHHEPAITQSGSGRHVRAKVDVSRRIDQIDQESVHRLILDCRRSFPSPWFGEESCSSQAGNGDASTAEARNGIRVTDFSPSHKKLVG